MNGEIEERMNGTTAPPLPPTTVHNDQNRQSDDDPHNDNANANANDHTDDDGEQELTDEQYDELYRRQVSRYNAKLAAIYEQNPSLRTDREYSCELHHLIREGIVRDPKEQAPKKRRT